MLPSGSRNAAASGSGLSTAGPASYAVAVPLVGLAAAAGTLLGLWLGRAEGARKTARPALPAPSQCPASGVVYSGKLPASLMPVTWIFIGNHLANLDFLKTRVADGGGAADTLRGYPVRLRRDAGYMRAWGHHNARFLGDQTASAVFRLPDAEKARAHDMVGVLLPFRDTLVLSPAFRECLYPVPFGHVDWLGWTSAPLAPSDTVQVFAVEVARAAPASLSLPILQSHVDLLVTGVLVHGDDFAAEWLSEIQWWWTEEPPPADGAGAADAGASGGEFVCYYLNDRMEARRPWVKQPLAPAIDQLLAGVTHAPGRVIEQRAYMSCYAARHRGRRDNGGYAVIGPDAPTSPTSAPPPAAADRERPTGLEVVPCPPPSQRRAAPRVVNNFLIGFGSIIQTASRAASDPQASDAAPCRISAAWGYVREWNFQAPTAQICALGLRKTRPGEAGATINGVVFPAPDDLSEFDRRENGYMRVPVPRGMIEMLSWHTLPGDANVYVYVPYAPRVVQKYGMDPATGYPRCCGAEAPEGLDWATEAPGLGLEPPSLEFPILQTYVDVCLTGCLEYGEGFAKEFIETTFLWSPCWLNERPLSRRPWVHQKQYVAIDRLLRDHVGEVYKCRKLESDYATLFGHGH